MIDVLLINPKVTTYQGLSKFSVIEPPVWCTILEGYLSKWNVEILDLNIEDNLLTSINKLNPRLIVFVVYGPNTNASTQVMGSVIESCKSIKSNHKILLVGGHIAALPEQSLEESGADYTCSGEGFTTIEGLLENKELSEIPNLVWKDDIIHKNQSDPLLDLNEIKTMKWSVLKNKYRAAVWNCMNRDRSNYVSFYTSLGCPYSCSFCCIQAPFREGENVMGLTNSYRTFPLELIEQQLDLFNSKGIKNIKVADELFTKDRSHVNHICDYIIKKSYNFNIWVYARLNDVYKLNLTKMKKAGINWLGIGVESGSEEILKSIQKGNDNKDIFKIVKYIENHDIDVCANYIFGLPEDTEESMKKTLELAMSLNTRYANFNVSTVYPGSKLYTGGISNWDTLAQYSTKLKVQDTKYLKGKDILTFRDNAFTTYFSNPKYIEKIREKYGEMAVNIMNEVVSYKIVREDK